jgi:hypothetical protein
MRLAICSITTQGKVATSSVRTELVIVADSQLVTLQSAVP